jgi:hypothetical protein
MHIGWYSLSNICILYSCKHSSGETSRCVSVVNNVKYTGHFMMFSVITNIYNEKTKGPTLMEFFTATGKLKKFFLTTRDVRCVHHRWHGTHWYNIQVLATHTSTSPVVHTSNISSCQKKKLFQFSCGCEQFHWGRSFGFLVINVCNHGEHYETPCI